MNGGTAGARTPMRGQILAQPSVLGALLARRDDIGRVVERLMGKARWLLVHDPRYTVSRRYR